MDTKAIRKKIVCAKYLTFSKEDEHKAHIELINDLEEALDEIDRLKEALLIVSDDRDGYKHSFDKFMKLNNPHIID